MQQKTNNQLQHEAIARVLDTFTVQYGAYAKAKGLPTHGPDIPQGACVRQVKALLRRVTQIELTKCGGLIWFFFWKWERSTDYSPREWTTLVTRFHFDKLLAAYADYLQAEKARKAADRAPTQGTLSERIGARATEWDRLSDKQKKQIEGLRMLRAEDKISLSTMKIEIERVKCSTTSESKES